MYFRNFVIFSPLEEGGALHLNKLESPSLKDALFQVRPSGSGDQDKNVKSLRHYDIDNDNEDDGQRTNFKQKSSLEPSAEVS